MIIRKAAAHGVRVRLVYKSLTATGPVDACTQWLPTLERLRDEIPSILKAMDDTSTK
jgi:hypothetical protein